MQMKPWLRNIKQLWSLLSHMSPVRRMFYVDIPVLWMILANIFMFVICW